MFGAKKADIDYFKTKTVSQAVDELLNPTAPQPSPPVKEYTTSTQPGTPDGNIAQGTTWINDINSDGVVQSQRIASYKKWWTGWRYWIFFLACCQLYLFSNAFPRVYNT